MEEIKGKGVYGLADWVRRGGIRVCDGKTKKKVLQGGQQVIRRKTKEEEEEMEGPEQVLKSRVVKVDSEESWDILVTQANNQGCPLYCCFMLLQTDYLRPVSLIIFLRVLVHFTAAWCMPSVAMNPLFEELAMNYQDVLFLLVDVDEVKEVASKMDIKAMPTFLLMRDGTQVDKLVGANPEEIRKRIDGFVQSIRSQ